MDAYVDVDAEDVGNVMGSNLPSTYAQQTTINNILCNVERVVIETAHDSDIEDEDFSSRNKIEETPSQTGPEEVLLRS